MSTLCRKHGWSTEDSALFRLARQAQHDVFYGGCRAITLAKRLGYGDDVVSAVYASRNGSIPASVDAVKCRECGTLCVGQDNAARCCAFEEETNAAD